MRAVRWAAIGRATARELAALGIADVWLPTESNADAIGRELPVEAGQRAVWFHGDLADDQLARGLVDLGVGVKSVVVYRTNVAPATSRAALERAVVAGPLDAVVLASPSAARGLLDLANDSSKSALLAAKTVCVGPRTAAAARDLGFDIAAVATSQDESTLAELVAETLAAEPAGVMS